jgi:hypothetical protein
MCALGATYYPFDPHIESIERDKYGKLNGNYYQNDNGSKYEKSGLRTSGNHKCNTGLLQFMKRVMYILQLSSHGSFIVNNEHDRNQSANSLLFQSQKKILNITN